MYNRDNSSPTLTNVIFRENKAKFGGGLYNRESSGPTLTNLTFYGNIAEGGGIFNFYNHIPITLTNCIVWGNSPPDDSICNVDSTTNISYSLVQGGCPADSSCDQIWNEDPKFENAANGDLRLKKGSPAIDAGKNAAVPPGITTDLDGNPRICGDEVDMGAYEYQTENCSQP